MGRVKKSVPQRRSEIISAWQRHWDYSDHRAAEVLHISTSTLMRRKRDGDWSLEELHNAIMAFKIPPNDALDLLTIGCMSMESFVEKERRRKNGLFAT